MSKLTILCVLGESSDGPSPFVCVCACECECVCVFFFFFFFCGGGGVYFMRKKFNSDHET